MSFSKFIIMSLFFQKTGILGYIYYPNFVERNYLFKTYSNTIRVKRNRLGTMIRVKALMSYGFLHDATLGKEVKDLYSL